MSLGKQIAAKRKTNRKKIEVPEWGEDDAPLVIYVGLLSCGDVDKLQRKHPNFMSNPTVASMVDLIIMKAEGKDGKKLFDLEDKIFLMAEPVTVVSQVAGEMFTTVESVEEAGND